MNNTEFAKESMDWLRFPVPVYNGEGFRLLMSKRLGGGQFYLEWDGTMLAPTFWRKRTAGRVKDGEREFGKSFAEALSEAATHFGVSYSTLHRIVRPPSPAAGAQSLGGVNAATFYRIRKASHPPDSEAFRRDLDSVVLGPKVGRLIREYLAYVERELDRLTAHRSVKHELLPPVHKQSKGKEVFRKDWLARQKFFGRAKELGAPATRARLGDLRVWDPIVGWKQMREGLSTREFSRILRAGYRREERLLRNEMQILRGAIMIAGRMKK